MKACFGGRWKLGLQLKCLTHYLISYDAPSKKLWLFWVIKNIHIWWSTVFKMFMLGSYCLVAKLCLTLWNPTDCSPPGSSDHEIFQARILEWVAISFALSRSGMEPASPTWAGGFFTAKTPGKYTWSKVYFRFHSPPHQKCFKLLNYRI